ncbi:uncharacterized protein TNCV_1781921 [Trichonephila clavipes]|nr:uncharacterized protein TNCV_1781921 [Trichonephila clavipes]
MVLLTNLESFTLNKSVVSLTSLEFTRGMASKMNSIAARLPKIAIPSGTVAIVRVQYFVRGGFVGYRSRVSSKHLSPHLPVDELDSSGGQKGVALQVQDARVGVGSNKRCQLDVDVRRSDITTASLRWHLLAMVAECNTKAIGRIPKGTEPTRNGFRATNPLPWEQPFPRSIFMDDGAHNFEPCSSDEDDI